MAMQSLTNMNTPPNALSYHRPAASQIFEFVRNAIISMKLMPGQLISETALAQEFGVSRTPVREALIKLNNIGFIEVLPQRGTYVSKLSMEKILEARFIREALEISVVSQLAANSDDSLRNEVVLACEKIITEQKNAVKANDSLTFQLLDDEFHQTLAKFVPYPRVGHLIESEKAHMDRIRNLSFNLSDQYKRVITQHAAILNAIKIGAVEKSIQSMSLHMQDVFNILKLIPQEHPEYFTDDKNN